MAESQAGWLSRLASIWLSRIRAAQEAKAEVFGQTADILWRFLTRSYTDLYLRSSDVEAQYGITHISGEPFYKPRLNKCREFVALYLPFIAARTPVRTVNLRRHMSPEAMALLSPTAMARWERRRLAAKLLEWWLNYCAAETDAETAMRQVVQEALVKGRGCAWTEFMSDGNPSGERLLVTSVPDTVDNLLCDPDARTWAECGYIIRRRIEPPYLVQKRLGVPDDLLAQLPRLGEQSPTAGGGELATSPTAPPKSIDTTARPVVYYEIYSRIGVGHVLDEGDHLKPMRNALDRLGSYVMLDVAEGIPFPLNVRPDMQLDSVSDLVAAMDWPVRFYGDPADPWPVTVLDFMPNVDNPWASSPLEPGLPMQIFLDHLYAYIMSRAKISARVLVVTSRELTSDLREKLISGNDLEIISVPDSVMQDLAKSVLPLDLPPIKPELWQMVQLVERAFERAVGLDPLLYGSVQRPAPRSATEVSIRNTFLQSRPNDFADAVERWSSRLAAKEGVATRMHISHRHVAPLFGEGSDETALADSMALLLWAQEVTETDPYKAAAEYEFDVVSGSGRRKNKEALVQAIQSVVQTFGAQAMQMAAAGNVEPYNKVISLMSEAIDMDLSSFMLQPPAAQPQMEGGPNAGNIPTKPASRGATGPGPVG